ncbi:MAG: IS1634 family transposase [Acidimicrobiia bacterium]
MYLRTTKRKRKDGSEVRYLQLAHNDWDATAGQSRVRVIYNFGREDLLDRDGIARLISSLSRALPADQALAVGVGGDLTFTESRPMGAAYVLDQLWGRLGIDKTLRRLIKGTKRASEVERVLFALVANRAIDPSSKLAATAWVRDRVHVDGLDDVDADACYRAMDWLLEVEEPLAEAIYWATADLLNLEVDLLFFDTTSTYFEIEQADDPAEAETVGFRTYGHSKDHRPDLPQVIIGMAVTRTGIPIRVWSWPGNTNDSALIRQVKDDLHSWRLGRVVWVADRGFASEQNRRYLQRAGGSYILGEKLRGGTPEAEAALGRQGRYHTITDNLEVKEVVIDDGAMRDRFVICRNPEAAERDRTIRDQLLAQLADVIDGTDKLSAAKRAELAGSLPVRLRRFLRTTPAGLLRIDRAAVAAEQRLDGKFLLRSADPTLSAEDIALGYKQLLEVERGWRDMKSTLELRPVFHRLEHRIRAHVVLCWLALLLIRIAETGTGDTWRNLRHQLNQIHLGTFCGPAGTIKRRTATTHAQARIFAALNITEPQEISKLQPATTRTA